MTGNVNGITASDRLLIQDYAVQFDQTLSALEQLQRYRATKFPEGSAERQALIGSADSVRKVNESLGLAFTYLDEYQDAGDREPLWSAVRAQARYSAGVSAGAIAGAVVTTVGAFFEADAILIIGASSLLVPLASEVADNYVKGIINDMEQSGVLKFSFDGQDYLRKKQFVFGSDGSDQIIVVNDGVGLKVVYGLDGKDEISGTSAADKIVGGKGGDILLGGSGNDVLIGRGAAPGEPGSQIADDDTIYGGAGDDQIYGEEEAAGASGGSDTLYGDGGDDQIYGSAGHDYIVGGGDNDMLYGGVGSDRFVEGSGNDSIDGDADYGGAVNIPATASDIDTVSYIGTAGGLEINIGAAAQQPNHRVTFTVQGASTGTDTLTGIEVVELSNGEDTIRLTGSVSEGVPKVTFADSDLGGGAKDVLDLSGLSGGGITISGGDTFQYRDITFSGFERIIGTSLNDKIELSGLSYDVEIDSGEGEDVVKAGAGDDHLIGGGGKDKLEGGQGADAIEGDGGNDELLGGDGDDELKGGAGDDQLQGDAGDDILEGGDGRDNLQGGAGNDTYIVSGNDTIQDSDSSGSIRTSRGVLSGGKREEESEDPYEDSSGNLYFWNKRGDLRIKSGSDYITVKNFSNGSYGITLREEEKEDDDGGPDEPPAPKDPLVLDLDGDGVEGIGIGAATFDTDGDGIRENLSWIAPDDGLLVRDRNQNGLIDNINELYGSAVENGFDALAREDANRDGYINNEDAVWSSLQVWKDLDSDGITDEGELLSMGQAGIASISLTHTAVNLPIGAGNVIESKGSYTTETGANHDAAAVLFSVNAFKSQVEIPAGFVYPDGILNLPELNGYGRIPDLSYAMALDAGLASAVADLVRQASTLSGKDLRSGIENLLWRWAGVDTTDPASRGPHIDARVAEFVESVRNSDLVFSWFSGISLKNPETAAQGRTIQGLYNTYLESFSLRFMSQVALSNLLISDDIESALSNPLWAFQTLEYNTETGIIRGKLTKTVEALVAHAPDDTFAKIAHFEKTVPFLRILITEFYLKNFGQFGGFFEKFEADFQLGLTAINDVALLHVIKGLYGRIPVLFGTEGDDQILTSPGDDRTIVSGKGDDIITVSSPNGAAYDFVYIRGDGNDVIEHRVTSATDRLLLVGIDQDDVQSVIRDGSGNIILNFIFGGSVRVNNYAAGNIVEILLFSDGSTWAREDIYSRIVASLPTAGGETIVGFEENADILNGGRGNDILSGLSGGDTYLFGNGDGLDIVDDRGASQSYSIDRIKFVDGLMADLRVARDGNDAILTFSGRPDDVIRVKNQFSQDRIGEIEVFEFSNGAEITANGLKNIYLSQLATSSDDAISGFVTDDVIEGRGGNDTLRGGAGNDTYIWRPVDGSDIIEDGGVISVDTLRLDGVLSSDVSLIRSGSDLLVSLNGEVITIKGQFSALGWNLIERFEFADATWTASEAAFQANLPLPTAPTVIGTTGNDTVTGTTGNNAISGGAGGNDRLVGLSGSDSYFWGAGGGDDSVDDSGNGSAIDSDTIVLGFDSSDVVLGRFGNDLIIRSNTNELLTVIGQFAGSGRGIEQIVFADGTTWREAEIVRNAIIRGGSGNDTLVGTSGDDHLNGGAGDDILRGQDGNDRYSWTLGDGNDRIDEQNNSIDRLVLGGVSRSDVEFNRSGDGLVIRIPLTGETIIDPNFFAPWPEANSYGIDYIEFSAGDVLSKSDVRTIVVTRGTDGDEQIIGSSDVDRLVGGKGNDYLLGNEGDDTYFWQAGDGNDEILDENHGEGPDADTLRLTGVDPASVTLSQSDLNLLVQVGNGEVITVLEQFWSANGGIGRIVFDNGIEWSRDVIIQRALRAGRPFDDNLVGGSLSDQISAGGGNDSIIGGAGDDYLSGDDGSDNIEGGSGNDTIYGGNQYDYLFGGSGDDTLFGGDDGDLLNGGTGNDTVDAGSGDDEVHMSAGDDILIGGSGSDRYLYADYRDSDTIVEGAGDPQDQDSLVINDSVSADFDFRRVGEDLILRHVRTGQNITISNHFLTDGSGVEEIYFADSQETGVWDRARIEQRISLGPTNPEIVGTAGADNLVGDYGRNVLKGLGGGDLIEGHGDNDIIEGGAGDDVAGGGDGDDTIIGGEGDDRLSGGDGDDEFIYVSGDGADQVDGGLGFDLVDYSGVNIGLNINLSTGAVSGDGLGNSRLVSVEAVIGGAANDVLIGSADEESLVGGDGDDIIDGGCASDQLEGGTGQDTFVYSASTFGHDRIWDFATGVADPDVIEFNLAIFADFAAVLAASIQSGSDTVIAYDEGNTITLANVLLADLRVENFRFSNGSPQPNVIHASPTGGYLAGTDGVDHFIGAGGDDTFYGAKGNDAFEGGGAGYDQVDLDGAATDWTFSRIADGSVTAVRDGWGTLSLKDIDGIYFYGSQQWASLNSLVPGSVNVIHATEAGGYIQGTDGIDHFIGGAGNDTFYGFKGNDIFEGGSGGSDQVDFDGLVSDWTFTRNADGSVTAVRDGWGTLSLKDIDSVFFYGNAQWSMLDAVAPTQGGTFTGTPGDDALSGTSGNDQIDGLAGNDVLHGLAGKDIIHGGLGNDELFGEEGDDELFGGAGHDLIIAGDGNDILNGDDSDTDAGDDILSASGGNDALYGFAGNDILYGEAGDDLVFGGLGDDRVYGNEGDDELTGGAGNDSFVFASGFGKDIITDFDVGAGSDDVIEFEDAVFADLTAVLAAASQVGADTLITYDAGNTITLKNVSVANLHTDDFRFV